MNSELEKVWKSFGNAVQRSEEMVEAGEKPNADGLILAVLQVIAWELRTIRANQP